MSLSSSVPCANRSGILISDQSSELEHEPGSSSNASVRSFEQVFGAGNFVSVAGSHLETT